MESMPLEKWLYHEISVTSDFYALGHFVLFLLYSNYQVSFRKELGWEDELKLGTASKRMIRKMLKLESCYENVDQNIIDVKNILDNI
jgi:serine/threonine-protein kinase